MHLSFKSKFNKEHNRVILHCRTSGFEKNYSSFLDFTPNHERTSGIFVPCIELSKDMPFHFRKMLSYGELACILLPAPQLNSLLT